MKNTFLKSLTFMHIISHIILTNDDVKLSNTNWSRCELLKLYVFADFAFTFTSQSCLRLIRSTIISLTTLDCYSQKIEKRRFAELMWLWGIHTLIYFVKTVTPTMFRVSMRSTIGNHHYLCNFKNLCKIHAYPSQLILVTMKIILLK